ncbi:hypothetical protein EP56_01815 [Listeriaceae bacterium FSL A5-0209]|nr:hypothetical protein EP56_01815 [Listeriaceae bacterium FSL A5-0209]
MADPTSLRLRTLLIEIINNTFDVAVVPMDKFHQFYVECHRKEGNKDGDYSVDIHRIRIYNLSREPQAILVSALHDVAHHLEAVYEGKTSHSAFFYQMYQQLLCTAIGMRVLPKTILYELDGKTQEKLQKEVMYRYWEIPSIPYQEGLFTIEILRGYEQRDFLKENGYEYFPMEEIWRQTLSQDEVAEERTYLQESGITDQSIQIWPANEWSMAAKYTLIIRNAFDHKAYLQKIGYQYGAYDTGKRNWAKKIFANQLQEEREKLFGLLGINLQIQK